MKNMGRLLVVLALAFPGICFGKTPDCDPQNVNFKQIKSPVCEVGLHHQGYNSWISVDCGSELNFKSDYCSTYGWPYATNEGALTDFLGAAISAGFKASKMSSDAVLLLKE